MKQRDKIQQGTKDFQLTECEIHHHDIVLRKVYDCAVLHTSNLDKELIVCFRRTCKDSNIDPYSLLRVLISKWLTKEEPEKIIELRCHPWNSKAKTFGYRGSVVLRLPTVVKEKLKWLCKCKGVTVNSVIKNLILYTISKQRDGALLNDQIVNGYDFIWEEYIPEIMVYVDANVKYNFIKKCTHNNTWYADTLRKLVNNWAAMDWQVLELAKSKEKAGVYLTIENEFQVNNKRITAKYIYDNPKRGEYKTYMRFAINTDKKKELEEICKQKNVTLDIVIEQFMMEYLNI